MNSELIKFAPIAQAICTLLHPHAEVVIHDLVLGSIYKIFNNLSKRKVGDPSLLEELENVKVYPDVFPPYFKTNWDGKRMKSMSATLRNNKDKAIGLLCINLDLSKWEMMHEFIENFLSGTEKNQPLALFKDDWREKINVFVNEYLKREGLVLKALSRDQMRALVQDLHRQGAFESKNAASYIADVLDLSRATIYNYVREI